MESKVRVHLVWIKYDRPGVHVFLCPRDSRPDPRRFVYSGNPLSDLSTNITEINEMFEAGVPARKFKSYVCRNTEAFAAEGIANDIKRQEAGETSHVEEGGKTTATTTASQV
jgi:hypothetical protein